MKLFRGKQPAPSIEATVHLHARLQPVHRHENYEDPLQEALNKYAPGSEIVGGGTAMHPDGGAESCDLELQIQGDAEAASQVIINALEFFGAPVGSWLQLGEGPKLALGRTHGFALHLDGTGLGDEVYDNNDSNEMMQTLVADCGEMAELQSWFVGPEWTACYIYGLDAERIRTVLESAPERFALARNSRVEPIT